MEKKLVIFGASGRAGRRAVAAALNAGHRVVAVVRDTEAAEFSESPRLSVVAGDVSDAASVQQAAAGSDAAIMAAARLDIPSTDFYAGATASLVEGLKAAGVGRLVAAGVGTTLEVQPGLVMHDIPDFPEEGRAFSRGHSAELEILRAAPPSLDWVVLAPPPIMLEDSDESLGAYQFGDATVIGGEAAETFSYGDFGAVLVQEAVTPRRSRELVAVAREG